MKKTTYDLGRFKVSVGDVNVEVHTKDGTFHIGVDNDGQPYISTGMRRIIIIPSSSNRVNVFQEKR